MAAVIPDAKALNLPQYSGQGTVYNAPGVKPAEGPNAMGVLAGAVEEEYKKQQLEELADAKLQLQLGRVQQDNAYNQDEQVDTIEERWQGKMTEHLGNAAMNISEGELREAFVQESQASLAQGQMAIKQLAFTKKSDQQMAALATAADIIMKGAVLPGGDVVKGFEAIEMKYASAATQGYTSQENAAIQVMAVKYAIAEGKIKGLPPRAQIDALKEPWAMELPNHIRVKLRLEAEEELLLGDAQAAAYMGIQKEWTTQQMDDYLFTTPEFTSDPKLLNFTQQQFSALKRNRLSSKMEVSTELFDSYAERIIDGARDGSFNTKVLMSENRDDWKRMDTGMKKALMALEDDVQNGNRRLHTDRAVLNNLFALYGDPDKRLETKEYFYANFDKLNASDYEDWLKKVHVGTASSLWDHQKQVENSTVGMGDRERAGIYNGLTRWYINFQETHADAEPSDKDVVEMIDSAIRQFSTGGWFGKKSPYDMTDSERISAYTAAETDTERAQLLKFYTQQDKVQIAYGYFRNQDRQVFNDVALGFKQQGREMNMQSHSAFAREFRNLLEIRNKKRMEEQSALEAEQQRLAGTNHGMAITLGIDANAANAPFIDNSHKFAGRETNTPNDIPPPAPNL